MCTVLFGMPKERVNKTHRLPETETIDLFCCCWLVKQKKVWAGSNLFCTECASLCLKENVITVRWTTNKNRQLLVLECDCGKRRQCMECQGFVPIRKCKKIV